jgi:hypothetical protein
MPVAYRRAVLIPAAPPSSRSTDGVAIEHSSRTPRTDGAKPGSKAVISHAVGLPENANHAALNVASTIHLLQVRSTNNEPARLD